MNENDISNAEAFGTAEGIKAAHHAAAKITPELASQVVWFGGSWHKRAAQRMLHKLDFGDELQDYEVAHALGVISNDQCAAWIAAKERIAQAKAAIDAIRASDPQIEAALSTASDACYESLQDELYRLAELCLAEHPEEVSEEQPVDLSADARAAIAAITAS